MSDVKTTVDTYLAMWNEADPTRRAKHIERAWTDDARYVDPMLEAAGHAALSEMVTGVQARFPGHRFRRVSGIDIHHDQLRFAWELVAPDGAGVVALILRVGHGRDERDDAPSAPSQEVAARLRSASSVASSAAKKHSIRSSWSVMS